MSGFFSKNKRLFLLGGLGIALTCCGFGGLVFGGVNRMIRGSWAYTEGVARAVAHPGARRALGTPIEPDWMVTGSVQTMNGEGTARLSVPLAGPTRNGRLFVEAHTAGGQWRFDRLELDVDGAEQIDLLGD